MRILVGVLLMAALAAGMTGCSSMMSGDYDETTDRMMDSNPMDPDVVRE